MSFSSPSRKRFDRSKAVIPTFGSTTTRSTLRNKPLGKAGLSVEQRLENLERNAAAVAATVANVAATSTACSNNNKQRTIIDPALSALIRDSYKDYMSKNNSRGWLFDFSLLSMENIALHDHLLEKVRLHDNYSAHLPEHTPFIVARKRFVKEKIRHHYEHLADNEKKKTWDEDKLKLLAENNRRKSRMQTKMRRRKAAFARYKDAFELKYGPDCEEFVDRAYMSEEENNELDEYGNALNFFNLVPKWRTPKLQEFVNELDKPILAIKPSACKRCTRTPIPEETTSVPLDILATLPSWGVDPNVFL